MKCFLDRKMIDHYFIRKFLYFILIVLASPFLFIGISLFCIGQTIFDDI